MNKNSKQQKQQDEQNDDIQIDEEAILMSWHSSNSRTSSNQEDLKNISDSEQKNGKNKDQKQRLQRSQSQEDKDQVVQINQTIDFDDDLTSSIRQEKIKPKTFQKGKNNQNVKNKINNSNKINEIHKKINKSEVQIQLEQSEYSNKGSQSNQENSFSHLNEKYSRKQTSNISGKSFEDFNEQKRESFSFLNQKQEEFTSVQNYEIQQNDMEDTAFSKIQKQNKNSKNKFEDEDIFGELIVPQKSNLKLNFKKQSPQFNAKQQIDLLNLSLITEKIPQYPPPKKKQKIDNSFQIQKQERNFIQNKKSELLNLQQSFYMQPDSAQQGQKQNKTYSSDVNIICKDRTYFIQSKDITLTITAQLMKRIIQMFLQQKIMLPLFNQELLQNWKVEDNIQISQFNLYIRHYFQFLNRKYRKTSKKVVKELYIKKEKSTLQLQKQEQKKSYAQKFMQFFKKASYSKPQMLKKTLQSKLACIQIINDFPSLQQTAIQQSQKNKLLNEEIKSLKRKICSLEMLINFQKSELYCNRKLEQKFQENIWKGRKDGVIKDKNWYISNIFNTILI